MYSKVLITQSNYIPWKGYFDGIAAVDAMVIYDDMQYTKRDWRNRNLIKTSGGLKWLSIPVMVSGKFHQKINETIVADNGWKKSHLESIKQNYISADCFSEIWDWLEDLYLSCESNNLSYINQHFISGINSFLGIQTTIIRSEEFELADDRNQRLINICRDLGATKYFSGPAAKSYMDVNLFESNGIHVEYFDYSGYREYPQLYPPFEHGVTIVDLLMNCGVRSKEYMKS